MKRTTGLILMTLVCIGAVIIYGRFRLGSLDHPISQANGTIDVHIEKGSSFKQTVVALTRSGIIRDSLVFELYARYQGLDREIKAGRYLIPRETTPRQLLEALKRGGLEESVQVTIPEGWNRWQIADRLAKLGLINREQFLNRVRLEGLEGMLFPDTYRFSQKRNTGAVIKRLHHKYLKVWNEILGSKQQPDDLDKLITLASIAQKESGHYDEQQKIVRVFLNRLERGMKLQSDPTCVYSAERYREKPTPSSCRDKKNQYSTYVNRGLPPSPIGNPGRSALQAALNPYAGPDAGSILYFVATRDGERRHHFSKTYKEHKAAIQRYLKGR
ncbi:MAG: endolytic transglycosylase MltG [Bradymonadia bacterium]